MARERRWNRIFWISTRATPADQWKCDFYTRLRDEKKFSGPEALREQVLKDIERAREYFHAIEVSTTRQILIVSALYFGGTAA